MEMAGTFAAIFSAASQAVVHMIWKSAGDKLVIRALIGVIAMVVMAPFVFFVKLPTIDLWGWIAISVMLHLIYQLVLIEAYKALDFSVAYPLARGIAPIATALLGVALLGDRLNLFEMFGIIGVSAGLATISFGARPHRNGLIAAIAAGLLTTAYSLVDAQGIRLAEHAITFIAWFFVLDGIGILVISTVKRGKVLPQLMKAEGLRAIAGGGISIIGYSGALIALRLIAVGAATALRETSVVFAALLARIFLNEKIPTQRLAGIAMIVSGSVLIALKY